MGLLEASEIEKIEPPPPNFPEEDILNFTLVERLLPSVPTFLLLTSGIFAVTVLYLSGRYRYVSKLCNLRLL